VLSAVEAWLFLQPRRLSFYIQDPAEVWAPCEAEDSAVPLFDTTSIYVEKAVKRAFSGRVGAD
jgi:hypothetical protein